VTAFVAQQMPDKFLSFPQQRPETWAKIMILYPLLSVPVQELVYRTFFFHRYGPLFGTQRGLLVIVNGLLFGFAHIMFGNWVAIAGTAVIGMLLAYRYEATRSFWAICIEHALWGALVFTVGLGGFFFTGQDNMPAWNYLQEGLKLLERLMSF
jgi:membrane protease YdiL (CAAX protease family)